MAAITNIFTDTISISYSGNGKTVSTKTGTYTGTHDAGVALVVPAGSVDLLVAIEFPVAGIQSLVMAASEDVTVKTNAISPPADSFTVKKTAGVVWGSDYHNVCPFGTNVTAFYVSNAGVTDAKFDFRVLYN